MPPAGVPCKVLCNDSVKDPTKNLLRYLEGNCINSYTEMNALNKKDRSGVRSQVVFHHHLESAIRQMCQSFGVSCDPAISVVFGPHGVDMNALNKKTVSEVKSQVVFHHHLESAMPEGEAHLDHLSPESGTQPI